METSDLFLFILINNVTGERQGLKKSLYRYTPCTQYTKQGQRHLSFALFVSINHFKISEDKKCNQLLFVVYFQIFIFHSQWLDLQVLMLCKGDEISKEYHG